MAVLRFKICCIESVAAAEAALAVGASALGFVTREVGPPATLDDDAIAAIIARMPPWISSVLLTASRSVDDIRERQRRTAANAIQLVDRQEPAFHRALRKAMPGITLMQVVHVTGPESLDEALAVDGAHALLLDSGNPSLATKQFGGTGRTHDWTVSRRIRDSVATPVILAGGLNPSNVADAVTAVRPYAVDVCSGVRTDGRLDEAKLEAFARSVRSCR